MGRPNRISVGGLAYHVLNRANGRAQLFFDHGDYVAFLAVLTEARFRFGTRILAYCLMPNHWHLVLWPHGDGELSRFAQWLILTHTQRWHVFHGSVGRGHIYQGRFKSFPIETDRHLVSVCRYVERNPLRAGLVRRAEEWTYSSLGERLGLEVREAMLTPLPVSVSEDWRRSVNEQEMRAKTDELRRSVTHGVPYGSRSWQMMLAAKFAAVIDVRRAGRPKNGV